MSFVKKIETIELVFSLGACKRGSGTGNAPHLAIPLMLDLRDQYGETVNLGVRKDRIQISYSGFQRPLGY
jgi:hypothetical protein